MGTLRQAIAKIGLAHLERRAATDAAIRPSPLKIQIQRAKVFTPPAPNMRNALSAYEGNPFVHTIIDRISGSAANQKFFLRKRRGKDSKKITDNPILDFLHSGNELLDGYQCRKLAYAHIDLAGEAFLLLGYDSSGRPASYLPIPPTWVTQVAYNEGEKFDIQLPRMGGTVYVPYSEMIWLKRPRPLDPTDRGFSPTRALLTEIALNDEIGTYFYSFVKNRARPDIIITGSDENPMNPEDAAAMQALWMQQHAGSANAGKPMFSNVPVEVHEVGQTVAESKADELRKISRDFISEVYGVPPELFGRVENSNRATADAADFIFSQYVVEPRLREVCEALQMRLLPHFPELVRYSLHAESPVREDKAHNLNIVRAAPSAFRKNEIRAWAGLDPVDGGDEFLTEGVGGVAGTDAQDEAALDEGNAESPKKAKRIVPAMTRAMTEDEITALMQALEEDEDQHAALLLGMLRAVAVRAAIPTATEAGIDLRTLETDIEEWASERAAALNLQLAETTGEEIAAAVRAEPREGRAEISAAILMLVAGWGATRARMVASTEANGAAGFIQTLVGKSRKHTKKVWLTRADERVRGTHKTMHGQIRDVDQMFEAGNGERAMAPGGFVSAANNVNCRCGTRTFNGDPPNAGAMATMLAAHEIMLRALETELANSIQSYFATQAQSVLRKLGSLR